MENEKVLENMEQAIKKQITSFKMLNDILQDSIKLGTTISYNMINENNLQQRKHLHIVEEPTIAEDDIINEYTFNNINNLSQKQVKTLIQSMNNETKELWKSLLNNDLFVGQEVFYVKYEK